MSQKTSLRGLSADDAKVGMFTIDRLSPLMCFKVERNSGATMFKGLLASAGRHLQWWKDEDDDDYRIDYDENDFDEDAGEIHDYNVWDLVRESGCWGQQH